MTLRLQRIGPADAGQEIGVEHFPFVIGRRSECDYSLALACISRRHCRITREGAEVLIEDLQSHNGTYVNGRRALKPLPLHHGDELCLGPLQFRVVLVGEIQETKVSCRGTADEPGRPAFEETEDATRPDR
jgi:pSer/pThr/pTyr-binding forkhead associated (FHA) protein